MESNSCVDLVYCLLIGTIIGVFYAGIIMAVIEIRDMRIKRIMKKSKYK